MANPKSPTLPLARRAAGWIAAAMPRGPRVAPPGRPRRVLAGAVAALLLRPPRGR